MAAIIENFHPVIQALLGTLFTWGMTALGAATVFLGKKFDRRVLDSMQGFAAGVMIAASYWSLLAPALALAGENGDHTWMPAVTGFLLGGLALRLADKFLPHLHINAPISEAEGVHTTWKRTTLLILAITLDNIPEGLAVGVAFGAVASGYKSASLTGAIALASRRR